MTWVPDDVPGYVVDELEDIWRKLSGGSQGRVDGRTAALCLDQAMVQQLAEEIHRTLGVRLVTQDLVDADSLSSLGVVVHAAMDRAQVVRREERVVGSAGEPAAVLRLSSAQRRLWFMQQFAQGTALYNVPTRLDLVGRLDQPALAAALTDLLARHEILRTRYPARSGVPQPQVMPITPVQLPYEDLVGHAEVGVEIERLAFQEATATFRLDEDAPVRFRLVRTEAGKYLLYGTFHHIAIDGLSIDIVFEEISSHYNHHARGAADVSESPRQYADYARHQSVSLGSDAMRQMVGSRCAALGGTPTALELPTDRARPRLQRFKGDGVSTMIDGRLADGVRQLARRQRVTPYIVLLAAYVALLARLSGQSDVVVGTPASGRTRSEWERVVGCFINMVPVRTNVSRATTGTELLSRVSESVLQALEFQDVPFDELVQAIAGPRRSGAPLFTVMFSHEVRRPGYPFADLQNAELTVSRPPGTAKYDLSLYAVSHGDDVRIEMEYDTDLYDAATATALLEAYQAVLSELVHHPADALDLTRTGEYRAQVDGCVAS